AALGEIAKANPQYEPAWDLIIGEGVKLPVPVASKATAKPGEAVTAGAGTRVITSRDLYTALDAAELRHPEAEKLHRYDRIQLSEEDAANLGVVSGDEVQVAAGGVALAAKATVTERVPAGHIYVSSLFQGGAVTGFFSNGHVPTVSLTGGNRQATPAPAATANATAAEAAAPITPNSFAAMPATEPAPIA